MKSITKNFFHWKFIHNSCWRWILFFYFFCFVFSSICLYRNLIKKSWKYKTHKKTSQREASKAFLSSNADLWSRSNDFEILWELTLSQMTWKYFTNDSDGRKLSIKWNLGIFAHSLQLQSTNKRWNWKKSYDKSFEL